MRSVIVLLGVLCSIADSLGASLGPFTLNLPRPGQPFFANVTATSRGGDVPVAQGLTLEALEIDFTSSEYDAVFTIKETTVNVCDAVEVADVTTSGTTIVVGGSLCNNGNFSVQFDLLTMPSGEDPQLGFTVQVTGGSYNAVQVSQIVPPDEGLYGGGLQYTTLDLRGAAMPIISQEQGIGRGVQPLTAILNTFGHGAGGNRFTTYSSSGYILTSHGRSFVLTSPQYAILDFTSVSNSTAAAPGPAVLGAAAGVPTSAPSQQARIMQVATTLTMRWFTPGPPAHMVKALTAFVGRQQPVPSWVNGGAILGVEGGRDMVTSKVNWVMQNAEQKGSSQDGLPLVGVWMQDWTGDRPVKFPNAPRLALWWNWEADNVQYYNMSGFVNWLGDQGLSTTLYTNPMFVNVSSRTGSGQPYTNNYYQQGMDAGYFILTPAKDTRASCAKCLETWTSSRRSACGVGTDGLGAGSSYGDAGAPPLPATCAPPASGGGVEDTCPGCTQPLLIYEQAALLDLTNGAAVEWMEGIIKKEMVDIGARGWMHDFSEGLAFDSLLCSGADPGAVHNAYPAMWTELGTNAVQGSAGDIAFYPRGQSLSSPSRQPLGWVGDQLVSWDGFDGLQSALTAQVTGGLIGLSNLHSDIGGYTGVDEKILGVGLDYSRSPELLARWGELQSFSAAQFRSHPGSLPTNNANPYPCQDIEGTVKCVYSNDTASAERLNAFLDSARIFRGLTSYRTALQVEQGSNGSPVTRAMWHHFPQSTPVWSETDALVTTQFMMGQSLLVVPATSKGVSSVSAWLPCDSTWTLAWTGANYTICDSRVTVPAPLGQPALLVRATVEDASAPHLTPWDVRCMLETEGLDVAW